MMTRTGPLTGTSDMQLGQWLDEIRKVAALSGQPALDATDQLLWSVLEWQAHAVPATSVATSVAAPDPDLDDAWDADALANELAEQLATVHEAIARLREQVGQPASLRRWDADLLIQRAAELGRHTDRRTRERFADPIAQMRVDAHQVAAAVRLAVHEQAIRGADTAPIHSVRSLEAIARTLDEATAGLAATDRLTPELAALTQSARERLARYRSGKKVAEADVAEAGGSVARGGRLRREAEVLLRQDRAGTGTV